MEIHPVSKILAPAIFLIILSSSVVVSQILTAVFTIGDIEAYILSVIILSVLVFSSVLRKSVFDN